MEFNEENIEIVISEDSNKFLSIANKITELTNAEIIEKVEGLDQSYWDIKISEIVVTIHKEHYLGVSIFTKKKNKTLLLEVEQKLLNS